MPSPPIIRDWARRLINSELDTESSSKKTQLATLRVYEKLRRQLCTPVGVDAFQALTSRALSLAKSRYPKLSTVHVTANGGLQGFDDIDFPLDTNEDDKVGIILITELLGLVLTLLGEATTVRLIEGMSMESEVEAEVNTNAISQVTAGTSYLGPFEGILLEAEQLRNVSDRLQILMNRYSGIEQLESVASSIRSLAAVLDVFTLIRSEAGTLENNALNPPTKGYVN